MFRLHWGRSSILTDSLTGKDCDGFHNGLQDEKAGAQAWKECMASGNSCDGLGDYRRPQVNTVEPYL